MQLGFHDHNYEFKRFGATTVFAELMRLTDPSLVVLEMDCYWITQAGQRPIEMLQKFGSRIRMLHLKDRPRDSRRRNRSMMPRHTSKRWAPASSTGNPSC